MKIRPWEPAEYLDTMQDIVDYLEAVFEHDDVHLIAAALGDIAKSKGMAAVAAETGLGRESLYKALSLEGNPQFATILSVLRSLGLRLQPSMANLGNTNRSDMNKFWNSGFPTACSDFFLFHGESQTPKAMPASDCAQ